MSDIGNTGAQAPQDDMDRYLTNKASAFKYPPTPDIASAVRDKLVSDSVYRPQTQRASARPRRAWTAVAVALVLLIGAFLIVPQVRAFVQDIYIGVVKLIVREPGPLPVPNVLTPTPLSPYDPRLVGKTDFGNAELGLGCTIKVPTYPAGIGMPTGVYYQIPSGSGTVILLWPNPTDARKPGIALYIMSQSGSAYKIVDGDTEKVKTQVGGQPAYWVSGPHVLEFYDTAGKKTQSTSQLVAGNVLIWTEKSTQSGPCKDLTYRLESNLTINEAIKIAESLQAPNAAPTPVPTTTPLPTTTPVSPAVTLNLTGETTLTGVGDSAGFRVKIPVVPTRPELISPGKVFLQDQGNPTVIMAWFTADRTDELQLILYQIKGKDTLASRSADKTTVLQQTTVHSKPAQWVQGPHAVYTDDGKGGQVLDVKNFIKNSHTLVWEEDGITYLLETSLSLPDAVEIAESLK
ncbi:MAG: hypothetical protein ABI670_14035 [Chloroflexota bacterium]